MMKAKAARCGRRGVALFGVEVVSGFVFSGWQPKKSGMRPRVLVTDRENRECCGKRRQGRKPRRAW